MNRAQKPPLAPANKTTVRCAVYTRKSTEDGLDQAFNSLDAQREAGEAYVKSQAGVGWELVPTKYDDGGFTGANTERPALARLLADIDAGTVDAVVVYKVDRLSRSLLDFARLMAAFDAKGVSFVSVTQQFNTATSMGRLVLNVLLSFAQFEREIIAERTRDKIAATRRKGKWAGGHPVLGYTVDPTGRKLVVDEAEADRVKAIFELYAEHGSLLPVVAELARRGWRTKAWTTRSGRARGGGPFTRTGLYHLLTNVTYAGKVRYKDEVHPGEHEAIIAPDVWQAVQARLARAGRSGGGRASGALLQGVLACGPCGRAMTPNSTTKQGRTYRYYVCSGAQKHGRITCPSKSVPAGSVEAVVVDQVRAIGKDPALLADVRSAIEAQAADRVTAIEGELTTVNAERRSLHRQVQMASARLDPADPDADVLAELASAQDRLTALAGQATAAHDRLRAARSDVVSADEVEAALDDFDPVWQALAPAEQGRLIRLLVEAAVYDGGAGTLTLRFRPAGLQSLAHDRASSSLEGASA